VIDARPARAEDASVTRRTWGLLAVGAAVIVALGGFAFAHRGSAAPFRPSASWNMYPPPTWQRLVRRTRLADVHVVAADSKLDGTPVTLLAGTRGSATCFVATVGLRLVHPVCNPAAPLTVFHVSDGPFVDVVGVARPDIASVAETVQLEGKPSTSGVALVAAGRYFTFGWGARGGAETLIARDARNRVLARIHLRR
jgi:hypothetical protein